MGVVIGHREQSTRPDDKPLGATFEQLAPSLQRAAAKDCSGPRLSHGPPNEAARALPSEPQLAQLPPLFELAGANRHVCTLI